MSHAISLSEMIGRTPLPGGFTGEVFVTAEATYDDAAGQVVIQLDGHVCPEDSSDPMRQSRPNWMPPGETVRVGGDVQERSDITHDVFHSWVKRLTAALPGR